MPARYHPASSSPSATVLTNHMQLNWIALDALKASGRKSRTHSRDQIGKLAESIRSFGFSVPILVDHDNRISGRPREARGCPSGRPRERSLSLPCRTSPAEQKRAFILAENRLAELAGWDRETLRIELEELTAIDLDFDLTVIGFAEPEIDAILYSGTEGEEPGEAIPQLAADPVTRLGDLWLLGEHHLYCGDALQQKALEIVLAGELARTVFTDPPYNASINRHVTKSAQHPEFVMASGEMGEAEFAQFLNSVAGQITRALAPGGLAYVCMDWRHMLEVLNAAASQSLDVLNLIIWDKTRGGMGSFYRSQHELIFLLRKPGDLHLNRVELGKHGRYRTNVWAYQGVSGAGDAKAQAREMHPTVKPLALVRDAILDSTAGGDLVVDLFSGSGTTLIAAHETRRRCSAIELDPRYVDVGVIRWQDFSGLEARLADTGETFGEVRERRGSVTAAAAAE